MRRKPITTYLPSALRYLTHPTSSENWYLKEKALMRRYRTLQSLGDNFLSLAAKPVEAANLALNQVKPGFCCPSQMHTGREGGRGHRGTRRPS